MEAGDQSFLGVCMKNLLISELRVSLRSPSSPLTDSFFSALALTQSHTFDLTICLAHTQRRSTLTKKLSNKSLSISLYYFSSFFPVLKQLLGCVFFPGRRGFRLSKM